MERKNIFSQSTSNETSLDQCNFMKLAKKNGKIAYFADYWQWVKGIGNFAIEHQLSQIQVLQPFAEFTALQN